MHKGGRSGKVKLSVVRDEAIPCRSPALLHHAMASLSTLQCSVSQPVLVGIFPTAQRLQVEGAVLDDILDGYHRAGNYASGARQLHIQLVADLQVQA